MTWNETVNSKVGPTERKFSEICDGKPQYKTKGEN